MGAASEFVPMIVTLVAILLNVTIDLLHLPLLLPPMLSIYRTACVLDALSKAAGNASHWEFRRAAWEHFMRLAGDLLIVFPFGLAALPRAGALIRAYLSEPNSYVWITANQGLVMIVDVLSALPFLFTLLTGIRTAAMLRDLKKELEAAKGKSFVKWGLRKAVWHHFLALLLELLFLPLFAFAVMTWLGATLVWMVWRWHQWMWRQADPNGPSLEDIAEGALFLVESILDVPRRVLRLILYLPFVAMALLMTATLWRAVPYWTDVLEAAPYGRVCECTWSHFKRWALDVLVWLGAGVLVATVYRLPGLVTMMVIQVRLPPGPPLAKVTGATVTFPGRGVAVRVRGTKPAELVADRVRIFVGDEDWWNAAGAVLGRAQVFAARTMLPMAVWPSMLDLEEGFPPGRREFDAVLRLGADSERAASENVVGVLRNIADRFPDAAMDVVLECAGAQLIRLRVKAADLLHEDWGPDTAHELPVSPPDLVKNEGPGRYVGSQARDSYLEDLRNAVVSGLVLLALDSLALLGLTALALLFPWRLPHLFCRLLETKARARQLEARRAFVDARCRAEGRRDAENEAHLMIADCAKRTAAGDGPGDGGMIDGLDASWPSIGLIASGGIDTDPERRKEREQEKPKRKPRSAPSRTNDPKGAPQTQSSAPQPAVGLPAFYRDCPGLCEAMEKVASEEPTVAASWEALQAREDELAGQRDALLSGTVSPDRQAVLEKVLLLGSLAADVDRMYEDLLGAKPSLQVQVDPFWAGASCRNRDWSDKRVVVYGLVKEALLDVLGLLSTLVLFLSLARSVPFLVDWLSGRRTWRTSCFEQLTQLLLDVVYTMKALLVIVMVYYSAPMVARALEAIVVLKSPKIARQVVDHYAKETAAMWVLFLFSVMELFVLWNTYKAAVATVAWGIFVPAEMVAVSLQQRISDANFRRVIALATWVTLLIYPFALIFRMAEDHGNSESQMGSAIGAFCVLLISSQLLIAWCYGADPDGHWTTVSNATYDIHWSFANANALFNMALEVYQHVALVLAIGGFTFRHAAIAEDVVSPSLLYFGVDSYKVFFWLAVGVVGIWFVVAALPVVTESILQICAPGTISSRPLWRMLETSISTTFSLTIFSNLLRILSCAETEDADGLVLGASEEKHVQCYKGDHKVMALLALLGMAYFVPTATWTRAKIRDDTDEDLDVRFAPIYQFVIFISRFGLAAFAEVYSPLSKWVSLGASFLLNFGLAAFTFGFSRWYGTPPCPLPGVWITRGFGFAAAAWTALVVAFAPFEGSDASVPAVLMAIVIGYILAIILAGIFTRRWSMRHAVIEQIPRKDMRLVVACLLELEDILASCHGNSAFVPKWREPLERRIWRRLVWKHGRHTPKNGCPKCLGDIKILRDLLFALERAVAFAEQDTVFLQRRRAWKGEGKAIESVAQLAVLVLELGNGLPVVRSSTRWASECSAQLARIGSSQTGEWP